MRGSRVSRLASVVALALVPASIHAQASRPVAVSYAGAPLSRVAAAFASFAGQPITVSSTVGDPAITGSVQEITWEAGLDRLLAANALVARPDSAGGLRIDSERRITVEYQGVPLWRVLQAIGQFSGRHIAITPDIGSREVTASVTDVDWQRALERIVATTGLVVRADRAGGFLVTQ
jgi:type II secretory pathway component HofQ